MSDVTNSFVSIVSFIIFKSSVSDRLSFRVIITHIDIQTAAMGNMFSDIFTKSRIFKCENYIFNFTNVFQIVLPPCPPLS